jgi:hypothetical protein
MTLRLLPVKKPGQNRTGHRDQAMPDARQVIGRVQ